MKKFTKPSGVTGAALIAVLLLLCSPALAIKTFYPTGNSLSGGGTFCRNQVATLTATLTTTSCGSNPGTTYVSVTYSWYKNTVNSTVGGTLVQATTVPASTTTNTYTPSTASTGTLYYYCIATWSAQNCIAAGSQTSGTQTITVTGLTLKTWVSGATWSTATWSPAGAPGVCDSVVVSGSVTVTAATTVNSLTILNGANVTASAALTVTGSFTINNGGTYTHNNTGTATSTIFAGTENFGLSSNLVINTWYDGTVPLASAVTGNFGNVTVNSAIAGAWNQNGMFSTHLIQGTLTLTDQGFNFDTGAGATTSLALQDLVINGTSNVSIRSGAAPSGGTFNLTTKDVSLNGSNSQLYMSQNISMTFNWTATGNVFLQGDFFVTSGGAAYTNVTTVNISGDLTIDMALSTTRFDINYLASNNSPATLIVGGTTTIQNNPGWVHMVDGGTGNLVFTTTNLIVSGGTSNYFNMSTSGNSAVTVSGTATISAGTTWLVGGSTPQPFPFAPLAASPTGNLTANFGNMTMTGGDFRGMESGSTSAGTYTFNINNLTFSGGTCLIARNCNSAGGTNTFTATGSVSISYSAATDLFCFQRLASGAGPVPNTSALNVTIGGNFIIGGSAAGEFDSNNGTGAETINIAGNASFGAGNNYFNIIPAYGGNGHSTTMTIGGTLTVSGGTNYLSSEDGTLTCTVTGAVSVSGGTLVAKGGLGTGTLSFNSSYTQTGGTFYLHNNTAATPVATANVTAVTVAGDFSQTGGTINFDNVASSTAVNKITLNGANYTIGGTGSMTRAGAGTNAVFGELYFARAGTITFNRTAATHSIQQVKQYVNAGCTVNASASTTDMQIASNATQANISTNALTVNGILDMGVKKITAVGPSLTGYYSGITINNRLRTANTAGFYDGTTSACLQPQPFSTDLTFRMDYNLNANSTVEYYASANQVVTGKFPSGLTSAADVTSATASQYKYGILEINNQGTLGTNYAYPATAAATGNVFVRTTLVLTRGELNLAGSGTGQTITIENGAASAIDRNGTTTNGYIKSEETNGGNNRAKVQWNMGTATGSHVFPFGYTTGTSNYIPFTFNKTTAGSANITVSTRFSGTNNQPWAAASSVAAVANMYSAIINGDGSVQAVIDRWWDITASAAAAADLIFTYRGVENTMSATYQTGSIGAQHWNGTAWDPPVGTGTGVTSGTGTVAVSGANTFSPWVISALAAPLPIEIIYFDAACQDDDVLIRWGTATETNNDFFTIERSYDGINFQAVATVNGAGTSTTNQSYSVVDHNYTSERGYYRLKQTDFNGSSTYSPLISIGSCSDKEDVMYTLVNNEGINVVFSSVQGDEYTLSLYDVTGRKLMEQRTVAEDGVNIVKLPAGTLSNGVYLLTLSSSTHTITTKLVVQ